MAKMSKPKPKPTMLNGAVSDAAKPIKKTVNPYNTAASTAKAVKEYQAMLTKAAKTGKPVNGMTKNQISSRLNQLLATQKKLGGK